MPLRVSDYKILLVSSQHFDCFRRGGPDAVDRLLPCRRGHSSMFAVVAASGGAITRRRRQIGRNSDGQCFTGAGFLLDPGDMAAKHCSEALRKCFVPHCFAALLMLTLLFTK